jgi:hypothetical protein
MQGKPAEPSSPSDDTPEDLPEDPNEISDQLRQQMARLKRWFAWERWLMEPRSFAPPEESPFADDDHDDEPGR